MSEEVWSERDTTPDSIEGALRELLRRLHADNPQLAPARVLNLVVVVDREWKGEISNRLERVGRYNASRTILCAIEEGRQVLDAVAVMSYDDPPGGEIGVIREQVAIDMGPDHVGRLDSIVDPVVASELPTMLWSPHGHQEALAPLLAMTDVLLLDSDDTLDSPAAVLRRADELLRSAYVVDLAWLRTTPWRERLAASFDPPERMAALSELRGVSIRHRPSSAACALLLAGWLSSRLGWDVGPLSQSDGAGHSGSAHADGAPLSGSVSVSSNWEVEVALEPVEQDAPGLAGVTVSWGSGGSLSLDRGPGGLNASERDGDGTERSWKVLGASRGEGGILGEGVRQALLRDPTYSPALDAARRLRP